ncbi:hypothetical protein [Aeoliella mucimassa]|uniref:Uncharacterized protein n=1 Tax=Aeoliella mucimassa TaxID=2527972 RepID=A0A518APZ1_9BACT|nr:hypothetical protein [Aeoliella mucimassa]QDU56776.1 hypothetical protein Pan181_29880 [Aeoliella mucimassa]
MSNKLRKLLKLLIAICFGGLLAASLVLVSLHFRNGVMDRIEDHLLAHQAELQGAVEAVFRDCDAGSRVPSAKLPEVFKITEIQEVFVESDHLSLVVSHNPDTTRGFRVWFNEQSVDYQDQPTNAPGVYRFRYCNDYPDSPSNRFP